MMKTADEKSEQKKTNKNNAKKKKIELPPSSDVTLIPYCQYVDLPFLEKKFQSDSKLQPCNIAPFTNQVGGKPNTFHAFGNDLLKIVEHPKNEVAFYLSMKQSMLDYQKDDQLALKKLSLFMPNFYEICTYNSNNNTKACKYMRLENITSAFINPSIIDLKMGKFTCGPDLSPEKKTTVVEKMEISS